MPLHGAEGVRACGWRVCVCVCVCVRACARVYVGKPESAVLRSPWFCFFCGTVEKQEVGTARGGS